MTAARREEGTSVGGCQLRETLKGWKFGGILGGLLEITLFASFNYLQMVRMRVWKMNSQLATKER